MSLLQLQSETEDLMSPAELERWADVRNTSIEIARAIDLMTYDMETVWDSPTPLERIQVLELAFGECSDDELIWGASVVRRSEIAELRRHYQERNL